MPRYECPKCDTVVKMAKLKNVDGYKCPNCGGFFFDKSIFDVQ